MYGVGFEIEKKKRYKLIGVVILLASCILLIPILNNLREVLGIGHYNTNNNFNIPLSGGTGGLNVDFNLDLTSDDRHTGTITCRTISSGSVQPIGIVYISYNIYRDVQLIVHFVESFSTPRISFQRTHINLRGERNNELKCIGTANVKFLVGGIEQEETIDFDLSVIITVSSGDISYYWGIAQIWLLIIDGIAIVVVIIILAKLIRSIQFDKWYTEEHKKEDEEFFEKIREYIRDKKAPQSS